MKSYLRFSLLLVSLAALSCVNKQIEKKKLTQDVLLYVEDNNELLLLGQSTIAEDSIKDSFVLQLKKIIVVGSSYNDVTFYIKQENVAQLENLLKSEKSKDYFSGKVRYNYTDNFPSTGKINNTHYFQIIPTSTIDTLKIDKNRVESVSVKTLEGNRVINIKMNKVLGSQFANFTEKFKKRKCSLFIGNQYLSSPFIYEPITGNELAISGFDQNIKIKLESFFEN